MSRVEGDEKSSCPRPSVFVAVVALPSSLRTLPEQTFMELVRYIGGNTKHDVEAKYGSVLSNFKLTVAEDGVLFKWEASVGFDESDEIQTLLLEWWNYHCRNALMTLLQQDPRNNELKKDIGKIDAYAANTQGSEYYEKGDYDKALELFRKAVLLYSYDSMFYNNLGNALAMKERYDEAVQNLKMALRINPQNEKAKKNLSATIMQGLMRSGDDVTVFCPFPECEGKISVTLEQLIRDGDVTARCQNCDSAQVVINQQGVQQVGIYKYTTNPDFPRVLAAGLRDDLKVAASGLWLLDDANVLLKPSVQPDYVKDHDCLFELELYYVRHGVMPIVRAVLVILDHPKNPSIQNCLCNIASPEVVAHIRYLKTVSDVNLHVYDNQNHYCFTKKVPVAKGAIENSGGPAGAPLRQVKMERRTWPEYVETLVETAKSMCQSLSPEFLDFEEASVEFKSHPITCICEICGRKALTTQSQFRNGGHIDAKKLKISDAIQCTKCNVVLCMECALKRTKVDEQGNLISPFTCSVCGKSFSAF